MIQAFIAARGVTRCPTAVLVPTSCTPDPADAAVLYARDAARDEAAVAVARRRGRAGGLKKAQANFLKARSKQ